MLAGLKDYLRGIQLVTPLTTLVFTHVSFFPRQGKGEDLFGHTVHVPAISPADPQ